MDPFEGLADLFNIIFDNFCLIGPFLIVALLSFIVLSLHFLNPTESISEIGNHYWAKCGAVFRFIDNFRKKAFKWKKSSSAKLCEKLRTEPKLSKYDQFFYANIMNIYRTRIIVPRLPVINVLRI